MYIVLKMHLRGHHVCVFIACGLKIIAADVEHGAIASQTWGSSDALSNEDVRRVLNWESYLGSQLNQLEANFFKIRPMVFRPRVFKLYTLQGHHQSYQVRNVAGSRF